jgi:hypothetical protein
VGALRLNKQVVGIVQNDNGVEVKLRFVLCDIYIYK